MTGKSKNNRITKNTLEKIQQDLKALALAPPDDFSAKETVRQLLPSIDDALLNGRTMEQVHETLTKRGFQIKVTTLAKYVRETRLAAKAVAPDLISDVQEDGTSKNQTTPRATDQDEEGSEPPIKLMTFDEAERISPGTKGGTEMPRTPDDDMLDELLDQRNQDMPHVRQQGEVQGSRTE